MKKLMLMLLIIALAGCVHITIPIASTVNQIYVIKTQTATDKTEMPGANLEDLAKDNKQKAGDVKGTPGG